MAGKALALVTLALLGAACESSPSTGTDAEEAFPNRRVTLPVNRTLGFIANQDSDTVSVVDFGKADAFGAGGMGGMGGADGVSPSFTLFAEVPIGRDPVDFDGPRSLLFDAAQGVFYVALTYSQSMTSPHVKSARRSGYLQVLARDDLRPLAEMRLHPAAFALALSPDGQELAVSHYDKDLPVLTNDDPLLRRAVVAFFDPDRVGEAPAEVPLCIAPADITYGRDNELFVTCVGEDSVVRLDATTREVTSEFDVDAAAPQRPAWLELAPDTERLAVSYELTRQVGVLASADTLTLEHLIRLEGVPKRPFWLSPTRLLVPMVGPDALAVVNLETDSIEREIRFDPSDCRAPGTVTETAQGQLGQGRLFLVCQGNHFEPGSLLELSRDELDVVGRLELGLFPDRLVLDER